MNSRKYDDSFTTLLGIYCYYLPTYMMWFLHHFSSAIDDRGTMAMKQLFLLLCYLSSYITSAYVGIAAADFFAQVPTSKNTIGRYMILIHYSIYQTKQAKFSVYTNMNYCLHFLLSV